METPTVNININITPDAIRALTDDCKKPIKIKRPWVPVSGLSANGRHEWIRDCLAEGFYRISDDGKIDRFDFQKGTWVQQKVSTNGGGYLTFWLRKLNGEAVCTYVHEAVYTAIHGTIPEDSTIDHKAARSKGNNTEDNLQIVSRAENTKKQYSDGTRPDYKARYSAMLTDYKSGMSYSQLMVKYGYTSESGVGVALRKARKAQKLTTWTI